jgi:hypothetical protein
MAGYFCEKDGDRSRRNHSHFTEKKSTKLTGFFVMAQRVFILGELDGVN